MRCLFIDFGKKGGTFVSEIDSLEIQIESEAGRAISNLKTLEKQLNGIADTLSMIGNAKGLKELSKAAREATKGISGIQNKTKGISISSGIEPQMKKVSKSLEEMTEKYKDLGKGFQLKGDATAIQKQINSYSNALAKAKLRKEELEAAGKTSGNSYETSIRSAIKYTNILESLEKQFAKLQKSEKGTKDIGKSMKSIGSIDVSGWQKFSKALTAIKAGTGGVLKAIKKLGTGFSAMHSVIKNLSSSIGKLFSNMTRLAAKATNAVTSSVKSISNAFSRLKGESSGVQNMSLGIRNLIKTAGGLLAAKGIVDFGKSAINLGSDITEVENVVDTAFGSMASKAYDFAANASAQFGLSELAAKRYSGTMMAMLKSSNVAQDAAADMSITLAGLAGDLASFYNLDTDEAFQKLRAGISGETEPLKQLGINMNIVNLEAFAMSQGIHKAYSEMTLAEQTLLRYNYILDKTKFAQGDFARTAGTWANQLRLLRLNLQSIAAVIGQGLIAAILPAIKVLNKLMEKLLQAAKAFRDFMYVLTGNKIQGSTKGIADNISSVVDNTSDLSGISNTADDVSDGMEDAADGTDDLTASTKKLKKQLATLSFDQLNQLPGKLDDLGDLGLSNKKDKNKGNDLGLGDMGSIFDSLDEKKAIEPINKWAAAIRKAFLDKDWEGLGKIIAEMLNAGLQKIYKGIYALIPKVERALRAFVRTFNSFVYWFDWDLLGRTIGAGINFLVRAFNTLFDPEHGINLELLGRKLSEGFRGMIREIRWQELGNALGNAFMIPWRIASGFIEDMWRIDEKTLLTGWAETGIALAEAVHGIFEKINFGQIGETLSSGFNGIIEIIRNFRNQMAKDNTWSMIAANISEGLTNLFKVDLKGMAEQASGLVLDILHMLNSAVENAPFYEFGYKIAEALFSIDWLQTFNQVFDFVAATFGEATLGFINYLTTNAEQLGSGFATWVNTLFDKVKYLTANIPWEDISMGLTTWINTAIENIQWEENGQKLNEFVTNLLGVFKHVAENTDWEELGRGIGEFLGSIDWATHLGAAFDIIWEILSGLISGLFDTDAGKIAIAIGGGIAGIKGLFNVADFALTVAQWATGGTDKFTLLTEGAQMLFGNLGNITGLISGLFSPTGLMVAGIIAGAAWIITHWDEVKGTFTYLWENVLVPLGEFISKVFTKVWKDILSPALKYLAEKVLPLLSDTLSNLWKNVIDPLAKFIADVFKPIIEKLSEKFDVLWKNVIKPLADFLGTVFAGAFELISTILNNVVIPVVGAVIKIFQFLWNNVFAPITSFVGNVLFPVFSSVFRSIGDVVENVRKIFKGLIDFIVGVFSGDWGRAWEGVKSVFEGIWDGLKDAVRKPINGVIRFMNGLIRGVARMVNLIGEMLNSINIDIPDWVPGIGGKKLKFNIPTWTPGSISYLAEGGVLKRGQVGFLEGSGAEAVVPLEKNRQWIARVSEEMARNNYTCSGGINEDMLANAVAEGVAMVLMNNADNLSGNGRAEYIQNSIYLDGDVMARAITKAQADRDYRMNPTPQYGY